MLTYSTISYFLYVLYPLFVVVLVASNFSSIFKSDGTIYNLPFTALNQWNVLDSDNTYLYILDNMGIIYRTSDFTSWEAYTYVPNAISIKYWTGNGLLISDIGINAGIWLA